MSGDPKKLKLLQNQPDEEPIPDGSIELKRRNAIYYYLMAHKAVRQALNIETAGQISQILNGAYDKQIDQLIQQQKEYSKGIVPEVD